MSEKKPRAVIYARVSTSGKGQDPGLQVRLLRDTAESRGWEVVQVVEETASGAKDRRPLRLALLQAARRREIDVIMVYKLDRWGRSIADLVVSLQELQGLGVNFFSYTEAMDLGTPQGRVMAHVMCAFAEFERDLIRERVQAGVNNARAKGKILGRPKITADRVQAVLRCLAEGKSWRQTAKDTGTGQAGVARIRRAWMDQNEGRLPEAGKEVAGAAVRRILEDWNKYRDGGKA